MIATIKKLTTNAHEIFKSFSTIPINMLAFVENEVQKDFLRADVPSYCI